MPARTDPRKERAKATRLRIVEAAYRLFSERGYSVPLTEVATEAGVAVQTVYFVFHDKISLLNAVLTEQVVGPSGGIPPHEQPWIEQIRAEPDVAGGLRLVLANTLPIFERVGPLVGLFQGSEPEVAALWKHSEKLRYDGFGVFLDFLIAKRPLRDGLTRERALDLVFEILSPGSYFAFVRQHGWTPPEWQEMVVDVLEHAVFAATVA